MADSGSSGPQVVGAFFSTTIASGLLAAVIAANRSNGTSLVVSDALKENAGVACLYSGWALTGLIGG